MTVSRDTTTSWDATAGNVPFRAWVQAIHDKIIAAGLTQTADTGQIDPATVALPGVADTLAGFEIYRFNDSAQSGNPIFLKVSYYRGDAATELRLLFSVGKGSNGSGTLTTEMVTAPTVDTAAGNPDSANRLIHAAYSAAQGYFILYCTADQTNNASSGFCLVIERERKRDGTLNGNVQAGVWSGASATPRTSRYSAGAWANTATQMLIPSSVADPDGAQQVGGLIAEGSPTKMRSLAIMGTVAQAETGSVVIDGETRAFIAGPVLGQLTNGASPVQMGTAVAGTLWRLLLRNE